MGADAWSCRSTLRAKGDSVTLDRAVRSGQHVVGKGIEPIRWRIVLAAERALALQKLAAAAQVGAVPSLW